MDKRMVGVAGVIVAAGLLAGGWYLWRSRQAAPPYAPPPTAQAPAAPQAQMPAEPAAS